MSLYLHKSRFIELQSNKTSKLYTVDELCDSIVRGPFGSALKKEFFVSKNSSTYKVYEQKNAIQKNNSIGSYYITEQKYQELKRFECVPGDIIMSCSGTIGELYQLPQNSEKGVINQALCKFTLNKLILPTVFILNLERQIKSISANGTGIKNVSSVNFIKSLQIAVPDLSAQIEFVQVYNQIDKLKFQSNNMLHMYAVFSF